MKTNQPMAKRRCFSLLAPLVGAFWSIAWSACQLSVPDGIRATPPGQGPQVVHDLDAKPLPEIPFPNDLATRAQTRSPTGRRVNASQVAPTRLERRVREKIGKLDGFGTLQPITVRFDKALDIADLLARHAENLDFDDDAVFVLDIDPDSPSCGQPVLLDVGRGNYPLTLKRSDRYFAADPRAQAGNLLFETFDEDLNNNDLLDGDEDTDDDGVLDRPNVWPPESDPRDGLMTFYESETATLILRPVVPLSERTTYAVVLTERLRGADGQAIRSPFAWVHHLSQTGELSRLEDVFAGLRRDGISLDIDQVAFAWVFTTQSVTADLVAIREGLNGFGPLAWLAERVPPEATPRVSKNTQLHAPYLVETGRLMNLFELLAPMLLGDDIGMADPILETYEHVDYVVSGSFISPDFLDTNTDGLDPDNGHRENFALDLGSGAARQRPETIRFLMAVPKPTDRHGPPFPVAIYCHGYGSMRAETLGFAGFLARHGIASVGIDAWGHGLSADDTLVELVIALGDAHGLGPFASDLVSGRARDLDGDGSLDSGADYWTADAFHTRDVVRQTVADHFQLVRVLRAFDGVRTWALDQDGDGRDDPAGDFNGDGVVDAGGPDVAYFAWGQSMGGIHSAVLAPVEPAIVAAVPTAGGGGLSDIGLRTMLGGVQRAVMLPTMGPLIVGVPTDDGAARVSLLVPLGVEERRMEIATLDDLEPGDLVVVNNLTKGQVHRVRVHPGPRFRVSMAADVGDRFAVSFETPAGELVRRIERWEQPAFYYRRETPTFAPGDLLTTPASGFGLQRCTPGLRRMVALLQMVLEPADPANYGPHYFLEPLDIRPEGKTVTNLLEVACLGDQDVPIQTQATIGRAAGVIPHLTEDPRYGKTPNDWLIENWVYEGLATIGRFPGSDAVFDPDDLDEGLDGFDAPGPGPGGALRLAIQTATGVSGIRFAYMQPGGQHGVLPVATDPAFDMFTYFANLIARYFATAGGEILDDSCLATSSCAPP